MAGLAALTPVRCVVFAACCLLRVVRRADELGHRAIKQRGRVARHPGPGRCRADNPAVRDDVPRRAALR